MLRDRWIRIVGISLIFGIYVLANGIHQQPLSASRIGRMLFGFGVITVYWHSFRALIFHFRRRFPDRQQALKRLSITFLTGVVLASALTWVAGGLRYFIKTGSLTTYEGVEQSASFTLNQMTVSFSFFGIDMLLAVSITLFYVILYETLFFINRSALNQRRLKQAEREQEKLRAANLESQLDALKQQVNPHFLFNSLNILDSLIDEDPKQARVFLEELSTVYRYLLRSSRSDRDADAGPEQHLTDLRTELDFIESYFHLLKTRYGSGLSLVIAVDDAHLSHLIPPLTLQLLVENAVKHNIVLPEQPLVIQIRTDRQNTLQVQNTLQKKKTRVLSNGVGLSNILAKYQMLGYSSPVIQEIDGQFIVELPLIQA